MRHTWTRQWALTRLVCYPLIAASLAFTAAMLTNPNPTGTPRVVVEADTPTPGGHP